MSLIYRLMYRIGFTRWDTGEVPAQLKSLIEGPDALPPGRAIAANRVVVAPAGLEQSELVGRFPGWELASASTVTGGEISGPLLGVPRTWYRRVRR